MNMRLYTMWRNGELDCSYAQAIEYAGESVLAEEILGKNWRELDDETLWDFCQDYDI